MCSAVRSRHVRVQKQQLATAARGKATLPVQVRLDFSDLQQRLAWAVAHDAEAAAMAERADAHARRFIRIADIRCYWYRLLLEYAALLQ